MAITQRIIGILAISAALTLAGCSTAEPSAEPPAQPPTSTSQEEAPMTDTPITLQVNGTTISAVLYDNPAANSLRSQLPLTISMSDFGGQEVAGTPAQPLTMEGMPAGESAPRGTIGWYEPTGSVVVYYTDVSRFSGLVRIGHIKGDVGAFQGWGSARDVTIEEVR
ncbi:cyclophilin-like fold protein [Corynebacterium sp. S7]